MDGLCHLHRSKYIAALAGEYKEQLAEEMEKMARQGKGSSEVDVCHPVQLLFKALEYLTKPGGYFEGISYRVYESLSKPGICTVVCSW